MEGAERDDTKDWQLSEAAAPPLLSELERRIDEAMIVAKASEKAVMAVGDAALDAADQARRAADLAERATEAVLNGVAAAERRGGAAGRPEGGEGAASDGNGEGGGTGSVGSPFAPEDAALRSFSERADRVVARLQALERLSVPAQG